MSKGPPALLLALAAAAMLVSVGCGGDEDDGRSADVGSGGGDTSTPARYAKQATALCRRHRVRIGDEVDAFVGARERDEGATSEIASAAMERVILAGFRSQYEALRPLSPPRGDEDFLDLMLSKWSASLENGEEDLPRFFRIKGSGYSEFAEGTLMTQEYGIKGCGSLARSPEALVASF